MIRCARGASRSCIRAKRLSSSAEPGSGTPPPEISVEETFAIPIPCSVIIRKAPPRRRSAFERWRRSCPIAGKNPEDGPSTHRGYLNLRVLITDFNYPDVELERRTVEDA